MKLVIFDCDGTLVDSQHRIVAAMERAFRATGLEAPRPREVVGVVGLSLGLAIERLLPHADQALVGRVAEAYKAAFHELRANAVHPEPLYDGVREALLALAARDDILLGIATGKSRRGLQAVLEREGLWSLFHTLQTADTHPSKPHPAMIHAALRETGAAAEDTLMIGDTTFDMEMAVAARVRGLGAAWGYHAGDALAAAGAEVVMDASTGMLATLAPYLSAPEVVR